MPRFKGVYRDANGWYFKARTSKDPLTGKWTQATRRGFSSDRGLTRTANPPGPGRQSCADRFRNWRRVSSLEAHDVE